MADQSQSRPMWMTISLAINLFFGFLVIVAIVLALWRPFGHHRHGGAQQFGFGGMMRQVPDEMRKMARAEMEARAPDIRASMDKLRTAQSRAADAVSADPYDAAAAEQALADLRRQSGEIQSIIHEAMSAIAAKLEPAQRELMGRTMFRRQNSGRPFSMRLTQPRRGPYRRG